MDYKKINLEPLNIKHVVITPAVWAKIRPAIKELQSNGLWYDISSYYDKLYLRVRVNDYTQAYIEKLLTEV